MPEPLEPTVGWGVLHLFCRVGPLADREAVAGAVLLRGAIASQLYGVGALDPLVMVGAIGVLGLTSFVACWGPARRAAKVSPLVALSRQ